ncbi:MAG: ParB/RepB/Spo0J family partition protein [Bacillota bacterium]|nr:ParB/RepB/Spo0J family partition protein [Bacillota bacterium]
MPKKQNKRGLGKGLGALIPEANEEFILDDPLRDEGKKEGSGVVMVKVSALDNSPEQARKNFPEESIAELAESIRAHGLIQPLIAREHGDKYQLIAGERRLRGAKAAGLQEVPVIVIEADDKKVAELGLIENLQREDLSPLDEAMAFRHMLDEFGYSQENLGEIIGKSRSYIANSLRLLTLSPAETQALAAGKISPGHARAVLAVKTPDGRAFLLEEIIEKSLSVRQAEDMSKRINSIEEDKPKAKVRRSPNRISPFQREMENKLRQRFGTKVKIKNTSYGGCIEIDYYNDDDLNRILSMVIKEEESLIKE